MNRDVLTSILKTRTVAWAIVERFRLQERHQNQYVADAIRRLQRVTRIAMCREGVISVSVEDADPQIGWRDRDPLRRTTQPDAGAIQHRRSGPAAGLPREQLARSNVDLEAVEKMLRKFPERHRAIALPD